jgi:imidazole glycerol-phosphate synthase subunit HisF
MPCLLVQNRGLVKTVGFGSPKYVGDPINAVRIFNEKEVDELIVLDIDATTHQRKPDYKMIADLAAECRMPLCYGGGVKDVAQAIQIFESGVEKIALSSAAVETPELVSQLAKRVGSQSVVVILDVKRGGSLSHVVYTHNGRRPTGRTVEDLARDMESRGCGEIVVNSIDRDGAMNGYDLDLVAKVRNLVNVPITVLGGAGSLKDIRGLVDRFGVIGAAAGSLFVFKGPYRAVLINYPSAPEKDALFECAQQG